MKHPRGRCTVCGRFVALRVNGVTREHREPGAAKVCAGSARLPNKRRFGAAP